MKLFKNMRHDITPTSAVFDPVKPASSHGHQLPLSKPRL